MEVGAGDRWMDASSRSARSLARRWPPRRTGPRRGELERHSSTRSCSAFHESSRTRGHHRLRIVERERRARARSASERRRPAGRGIAPAPPCRRGRGAQQILCLALELMRFGRSGNCLAVWTSMLNGGGPQAGQHGDSRAVAVYRWGGLIPSRGPAGAPRRTAGMVAARGGGSQDGAAVIHPETVPASDQVKAMNRLPSSGTLRAGVIGLLLAVDRFPSGSAQTPTGRETTAASVAGHALGQHMPVDPEVLIGGLPNGLRFYIRPNPKPARQAELRLVVKAGSVLEDDDQRGLAHFVEHMQFQGSRHFPGQTIDNFLASIGLSIGSDANAATSFDDTQYSLRVPTDRPDILDRALTVLEDWAGGALFADAPSSASAPSCSPSGAAISAPTNGPQTSCAACSWRDRDTPTGRRSATRR